MTLSMNDETYFGSQYGIERWSVRIGDVKPFDTCSVGSEANLLNAMSDRRFE
jgi:hypothetical protein